MLALFGLPFTAGKMMGRGNLMYGGGLFGNVFYFFHIIAALLFLSLLFLAVVYLWKKIEMLDHEKDHHHDHKK